MANVKDIEGIGEASGNKLAAAGIVTLEQLLKEGATKAGRVSIAGTTGISEKLILDWVNRADLDRVKGVGSEYADLLEAAGVDTVVELATRNAASLVAKLAEVNSAKNLVRSLPGESAVAGWIDHAKTLDRVITH